MGVLPRPANAYAAGGPRARWQVPQDGAAGPSAPAGLITLGGTALGQFTKVRVTDDDTRLALGYPAAGGTITGQKTTAPGYYGIDTKNFPSGSGGPQKLLDLFDDTPLAYAAFYFKTTGHPGNSWHGKAAALLGQGWALLPVYVGRQQTWDLPTDNQISADVKTAAKQGTDDGAAALSRAHEEGLPADCLIFLDVEAPHNTAGQNIPPAAQTIAYIDAWLAKTGSRGALYDVNAHWEADGKTYYEAEVIRSKISHDPQTWVSWSINGPPTGVHTTRWPLDDNGDVAPVAVRRYTGNPQWGFAAFARLWQFRTDWVPPASAIVITDTGQSYGLGSVAGDFDFNVAVIPDPARTRSTTGEVTKASRRARAGSVTVSPATVRPGASVSLTVTLDRRAPAPGGTLVQLRCDSADVIVPTAVRVAAGKDSASVTAAVVPGAAAGTAQVTARTLYQLAGTPAAASVRIGA
jgi:hypothetical protein